MNLYGIRLYLLGYLDSDCRRRTLSCWWRSSCNETELDYELARVDRYAKETVKKGNALKFNVIYGQINEIRY